MKKVIRLTENDLHHIITESVNRILNEAVADVRYQSYVCNKNRLKEINDFMETLVNKRKNGERITSQELNQQGYWQGEKHDLINRIKKLETEHPDWKNEYDGVPEVKKQTTPEPKQNSYEKWFNSLPQHHKFPHLRKHPNGNWIDWHRKTQDPETGYPTWGEGDYTVSNLPGY